MIIEQPVTDIFARSVFQPVQPQLLLIAVTSLVNERLGVWRPARSPRREESISNRLGRTTFGRNDPYRSQQIDREVTVCGNIDREVGAFRDDDLGLSANRAEQNENCQVKTEQAIRQGCSRVPVHSPTVNVSSSLRTSERSQRARS